MGITKKHIDNLINNNFEQMDTALTVIRDEDIRSQEELRNMLGKIKTLLSLNRFALVDENNLNNMIRAGEPKNRIAVLVCDINGLKHVNDTKGDAAGDHLIKDACNYLSTAE